MSRAAEDHHTYCLKYLKIKKGKMFDYAILKALLDRERNTLFYAHFSQKKLDPLFFKINPYQVEEVRFMRRMKGPSFYNFPEVINQFHKQQDYRDSSYLHEEVKSPLEFRRYQIRARLKGRSLKFSAEAKVDVAMRKARQNWLYFFLYPELKVDSVFWEDGTPARYVREKDSPYLWIKGDHPLLAGEQRTLRLYYHGKLIERQRDWFYIRSSRTWYPTLADRQPAMFDLYFEVPNDFQFASIGQLIKKSAGKDFTAYHWKTDRPVRNASFNVGFFKEYKIENDTIPPVTVMMAETGHQEIAQALGRQGIGSGKNMEKQVGKDVKNSMIFFQQLFGPPPGDHFYATEIPYSHGEAFPNLIHLSWKTFQMTRDSGEDEIFRAHEVAHQWWGLGVDFCTYHDQWLSEGFAEFCGWWYFQTVVAKEKKDLKKYYKFLKEWRKAILGNRKYFLGRGKKAAPIWLGYRTQSSDAKGDYTLVIYKKGAWILHMLRTLLIEDPNQPDDSRFRKAMRQFYERYRFQRASTEDFIASVESSTGEELNWFFDQWVYQADMPVYRCSYTYEPEATGTFRVRGRIRQSEVPENFRMPMTIGLDYGNEQITAHRVWISGNETEFQIGGLEQAPRKVLFNYQESVLCEIKQEKWKE